MSLSSPLSNAPLPSRTALLRPARALGRAALLVALAAALLATAGVTRSEAKLPLGASFAAVTGNPADALVALPLDDGGYDYATHCVKQPTKGALALVAVLPSLSPRGVNWGINRCEKWGPRSASLHAEGRAVDWHLDVHNPADRAEAEHLIRLLLAPDADGNPHALARRLGVQGLIWDCRSWWGGDAMQRYSACMQGKKLNPKIDDTTAHRDHVHLELNKRGAKLQTSWWTAGPGKATAKKLG